jgi:hypothetical protein
MTTPPADDAHRLIGLEALLRRMHRCATAQEAIELVRRFVPDLARGGQAALFIVQGDGVLGLDDASRPLWSIAQEAILEGRTRRTESGDQVAVVIPGVGAVAVAPPAKLVPAEVRLLELFAEHAATALRRPGIADVESA